MFRGAQPASLVLVLSFLTEAVCTQFGFAPPQTPPPGQAAQVKPPVVATGMVLGSVVDSSGSPVSGAIVTLNSQRVLTNDEGRFLITDLPKGNYSVLANKPGYQAGAYGRTRPNGL